MKYFELKAGMCVRCCGLLCIPDGAERMVHNDPSNGLYINCNGGDHEDLTQPPTEKHFLSGETDWPELEEIRK